MREKAHYFFISECTAMSYVVVVHFFFISEYTAIFRKWEKKSDTEAGVIDFENLKRLMENLGSPQTHLELKVSKTLLQ